MRHSPRFVVLLIVAAALGMAPSPLRASPVQLDPVTDGILLGSGVVLFGVGEFVLPQLPPPWGSLGQPDRSQIDALDRAAMFSYSHSLDLASTVTEYTTFMVPVAVALISDPEEAFSAGVVYVEAVSLAMGVKSLVNYLVPRYRPYVYSGGASGVSSVEDDLSFPSGHTTMAFASATAGLVLFLRYQPDSPWVVPFAVTTFSLAATTATLRVLSGMHFVTDVLTAAALGAAFGYFVPVLHDRLVPPKNDVGLRLDFTGPEISLSYRY